MERNKKTRLNNKIIFGCIIFALVSLYSINNIVSIEYFSEYISLPVYTIIPGVLTIMAIWALSSADKIKEISKKSLIFLVLSFCLWFAAEQTWNLYEHVLDIDPYPSIADFFYISAPIFMFISLVIFLRQLHEHIKKKHVVFAILVSLSILIPILIMTFQANTETEYFEIAVALIYPIVDAMLLVTAIMAIILSLKINRNSFWILILIGIVSFVIADNLYLILVIDGTYFDGHSIDILWLLSYVTWNFAMYRLIQNSKINKPIKYQNNNGSITTKNFATYGINLILVLIIVTTIGILFALNYFWNIEQSGNFMMFFSLVLITLLVVFSSIIVILNSKLINALDTKNLKIDNLTKELIKAERLSAIGELAARLSHDLRNPLSVIKSSVEISLLRNKESISPKEHEVIQRINNAIQRMTNQIEDILDYVKTTELQKNQMSVKSCITNIVNELHLNKINIKIPDKDITILADESKLEIVFSNLLKNAIDAIGDNPGIIEIKLHNEENYVDIDIIDSGSGIEEDNINKIFEPLYTTKQTGTGLGLVSCKNIIEQHGGKISVKNNPTTFTITLPK
ncbi:MAG: GHKL domain-containing protein [Nitrosarchaeum sp.]|nr:GHKL domain-containing protein [Nitrosarchaeum sp.]